MGKWKTYKPEKGGVNRDGDRRTVEVGGKSVLCLRREWDGYSDGRGAGYDYYIDLLMPDMPLSFWVDPYQDRRNKLLLDWLAGEILGSMGLREDA